MTLLNDPRREGLGGGFGTACAVDKSTAIGELFENLNVDVPGLAATNGPLALDDQDGNPGDPTAAGFLDLIVDRLNIFVWFEVCDGLNMAVAKWAVAWREDFDWYHLAFAHQAWRVGDVAEDVDVWDILLVDDEGMEEVG
jgi:hypothetical protein